MSSTKSRLWDGLFWLLTGTLYAFALSDSILTATVFETPRAVILRLTALSVAALLTVLFSRLTRILFGSGLLLFAVFVSVSLLRGGFAAGWLDAGMELFQGLFSFLVAGTPYREAYGTAAGTAVCLLAALFTVLATRLRLSFAVLAVAAVLAFAAPVYNKWVTSPFALMLMMLCIVLLLAKKLNLIAVGKEGAATASAYALCLVPFAAAVFAASWALPVPEFKVEGSFGPPDLSGAAERFLPDLRPVMGTFTLEGAQLGGPVALGDGRVMDVAADEPLYLSGSLRDVYDGSSWSVSDGAKTELTPYEGNLYRTLGYPGDPADTESSVYGEAVSRVTVYPGEIPIRMLFAPPLRRSLETEGDWGLKASIYGAIEAGRPLEPGIGYTQEYLSREDAAGYPGGRTPSDTGETGLTKEQRAAFLALPDTLPERVRELAAELAADSATDYAAMKALEKYLAAFPYTLFPETVPADADFVDYFLFEGREGYCVYYASALAVMGRSLGVPTRYVEGYITPEEPDANGVYIVTGQRAHAWVEAYFDGFGWVIFEATRPYAAGDAAGEELSPVPEEEEPERSGAPAAPVEDAAARGRRIAAEHFAAMLRWVLILLAVGGGIVLIAGLLRLRQRLRFERIAAMPNCEAAVVWFNMVLYAAARYGFGAREEETAHGYAKRMRERLKFRDHSIEELAEIFSRAVYSKNEVTAKDCAALRDCHRQMLIRLLAMNRPVLRVLDRYILLRY